MKELINNNCCLIRKQSDKTQFVTKVPFWVKDRKRNSIIALNPSDESVYLLKHVIQYEYQWMSVNTGWVADYAEKHKDMDKACARALEFGWRVIFLGEETDTKLGENKEMYKIFNQL